MKIIDKIKEIISGWWYWVFRKVEIEEIALDRLNICDEKCDKGENDICPECDCPLWAKVRSLRSKCKRDYWNYIDTKGLLITDELFEIANFTELVNKNDIAIWRKGNLEITRFKNIYKVTTCNCVERPLKTWKEVENIYEIFNNKPLTIRRK